MNRSRGDGRATVPWVAVVAIVLTVGAYIDLKGDVMELRGRLEGSTVSSTSHAPDHVAPDDVQPIAQQPIAQQPIAQQPAPGAPSPATEPPATCTGRLTQEQVRAGLGRHARDVFDCYAQRSAEAPELAGPLRLTLWIDSRGAVSHGRIEGLDDEPLRRCVRGSLLSWHFEPPTGGDCAIIQAPFSLSPSTAR